MASVRDRRSTQPARATAFSSSTVAFLITLGFLAICALGGGASRPDVMSLLYLRPIAILCLAVLILLPGKWRLQQFKTPLLLLSALALVIAIQLIPLPPDLWLSLPGRERFAEAAAAIGTPQPWRPFSLTPDETWNSLLALLPAFTILIGLARMNEQRRMDLLPWILMLIGVSAVLALVQLAAGRGSLAYLYRVTHEGAAVGLFANRNHQAALLAMAFPLLRLWTIVPGSSPNLRLLRYWAAGAVALFLLPLILVTGSRAGLVLAAIGLSFTLILLRGSTQFRLPARLQKWRGALKLALWASPVVLLGAALLLGRAVAVQRLFALTSLEEQRLSNTPLTMQIAWDFFPLGSGFGSFDPVFRIYEPLSQLNPYYFNHAHNDAIELVLTGGLPALLILLTFLVWLCRRALASVIPLKTQALPALFARAALIMILILCASSLVDYPLRTPFLSVLFALACGWLCARPGGTGAPATDQKPAS